VTIAARKIRLIMHLRRAGIADTAVLSAIERIPREAFVPESFQDQSYEDMTLPVGRGQTLSAPSVVAQMTQALRTDRRTKVLEIGTGTGYQAAVLSRLCRRLYTIERHRDLLVEAERRLLKLRLYNITTRVGDGARGWPEQAPFTRIIVTAAAETVPATLVDQLAPGGIMVVPVGRQGGDQALLRLTREADGIREEILDSVRFVPLVMGLPSDAA
jgi:protein-L-isoaspartate(D-aspartate) O-methyltransferase